jgi:hypothetical protein
VYGIAYVPRVILGQVIAEYTDNDDDVKIIMGTARVS